MNNYEMGALLKSELNRRMSENQRYSLRAFARALKLDPSTLSKIMNGQRRVGEKAKATLLNKLGIKDVEQNETYRHLEDSDFEQMPEWYDTAILEQITVTGFKATKKSLAQVFELSEIQIASALMRLEKLKFIKISKSGIVTDGTSGRTTNINTVTTNLTKRNLQKQFLEKAIHAIDHVPLDERDMTTITCAIDESKIPEAKLRIKEFRRDMAQFLTSGRKAELTYNMSIALYPLTRKHKESL